MNGNLNPRVIGACAVGFGLVAGAYVLTNFGAAPNIQQSAAVLTSETTARAAIAVVDADNNGIEDWRDEFIDTKPIVIEPVSDEFYDAPETLTGQLGVNFIESYLRSKTHGAFGRSSDEIISDTVQVLATETAHQLYDVPDITIMTTWEDADVVTYANTMALSITNNDVADLEGELYILSDVLDKEETDRITELETIAQVYQQMRDDALATPVPRFLVKEHLDLINTYHALHKDVAAMAITVEDPAFGLMRLKRYEDDVTGLGYALENMYQGLVPYAALVEADDPALLFIIFSPEFTS